MTYSEVDFMDSMIAFISPNVGYFVLESFFIALAILCVVLYVLQPFLTEKTS